MLSEGKELPVIDLKTRPRPHATLSRCVQNSIGIGNTKIRLPG